MPSLETDLIDIVRARLQGIANELDGLRARAATLVEETRWRSSAFAGFADRAASLGAELARADADAEELRHDLLRARAIVLTGGSGL